MSSEITNEQQPLEESVWDVDSELARMRALFGPGVHVRELMGGRREIVIPPVRSAGAPETRENE